MTKLITYGEIRAAADDVQKTRTVQFEISNANKDRHGTVLNMDNWVIEHFNANPVVGYQHNVYGDNLCTPPNPDDVLGPGRAWVEEKVNKTTGSKEKVLMGEVTFETEDINPQAEKIFKKVLNRTLRATSVGFYALGKKRVEETKDKDGKVIDKTTFLEGQELLEFSIVNIPSNRQALQRTFGHHKDAALGYISRMLPELSLNEVSQLSVQQLLDLVEKKWTKGEAETGDLFADLETIEENIANNRKELVKHYHMKLKLHEQILAMS